MTDNIAKYNTPFNMFDELNWDRENINAHQIMFDNSKRKLQFKLENSAFRKGISTALQGLLKIAPSDHLPVEANFNGINIVSWNLLSDEHTMNFLIDLGEKKFFTRLLKEKEMQVDARSFFKIFFADLANFAIENGYQNEEKILNITINKKLLDNFIIAKEKAVENLGSTHKKTVADLKILINVILDTNHPDHQDFKTSIQHGIEIFYALNNGFLQWKERLAIIVQNKKLVSNLASKDILCLQECTSPQDMLDLLNNYNKKYKVDKKFSMIFHRVEENSLDHCVIIYDAAKYQLTADHPFGLAWGARRKRYTKPCLAAQFSSTEAFENKSFIVASIHHSGRGVSELPRIIEQVNSVSTFEKNVTLPTLICGDYNNEKSFFDKDLENSVFGMKMPINGTMAGFEYENHNKPIDGMVTNDMDNLEVNLCKDIQFASQVTFPINIEFSIESTLKNVTKI